MKSWWTSRAPRERTLLTLGGIAAGILAIVALSLFLHDRHRDASAAASAAQNDLLWMQSMAPKLRGVGAQTQGNTGGGRSLLALTDAGARASGLGGALRNVEPQPNGRVMASFEDVSFDALMRWLEPFAAQHGVRVEAFSAQRAEGMGLVDVRLTLIEAGRE